MAEINDQLRPGERLVMTSRTAEYRAATHPAAGPEITLAAAAVELRPLDAADVIAYLRQAAGGPRSASRWDPLFAALACPGPLAEVLSNPLMVGLARVIYNPRPGDLAGTLPDPAMLCSLSSRAAIEGHLLDAFIPAAYRPAARERDSARRQWDARQAEKWLIFLAGHLESVTSKPGFAWWELRTASPVITDVVSGAAAGIATGIPLALIPVFWLFSGYLQSRHAHPPPSTFIILRYPVFRPVFHRYWTWIVKITISCGVAGGLAGLVTAIGPRRSGQRQSQADRWNDRDARVGRILLGILYGTTYSLIIFVAVDLSAGWPSLPAGAIGVAGLLAVGLTAALAAGSEAFRIGTVAVIVIGALIGAPFLLYEYRFAGYATGLPAGLAAGLAVMARGSDRQRPSQSIRWSPRSGIVSGVEAGAGVAFLVGLYTHRIPLALVFGVAVGLGAMVVIGFERVPGDIAIAISPIGVLKRDRTATVTLSLVTAVAAGLVVGIGTFLVSANHILRSGISPALNGVVFGLSIGPAAGLVFGLVLSGYGSAWPQWVLAREILAISHRAPRRLMAFLSDAHERGVLRQAGPVYQFRHIELQRRLASRTARNTSPAVLEERPVEYRRRGRVIPSPRPPALRHPLPVQAYFWLASLTVTALCLSILVASITPTAGHGDSPSAAILAGLGIMVSIWLGLYAHHIPSAKVKEAALWLAVARFVAPWAAQQRPSRTEDEPTESAAPELPPVPEPLREPDRHPATGSSPAQQMTLTALGGAALIALLTVVLFTLTAAPRPSATLPDPHSEGVTSAVFSPDGTTLATADGNGSTYLWNLATRQVTATLTNPHSEGVTGAVLSPDGATLAAKDGNGSTYLWNLATRQVTAILTDPHSEGVISAVFSPDGTTLATTDLNGSTYLWNLATRQVTANLTGVPIIASAAFQPGRSHLGHDR